MKRILVVNVNWLGDVIFSMPVFRALKETYPDAQISCMAVPRVHEILKCIDEIDDIIEYDENGQHKSFLAKLRIVGQLKKRRFDAAFLLSRSFSRASMIALAKIPVRVGYENKNRGKLLTHIATEPNGDVHRSDYYLGVIESFGVEVKDKSTRLTVSDEMSAQIQVILESHGIGAGEQIIAIHPGGNWDLKRWPKDNFLKLIKHLHEHSPTKLVVTGAKSDLDLVADICNNLKSSCQPTLLTGKLSLLQFVALMKEVALFISADSGPLHIANSVGCSTIGIFGPTRPEITGPRGQQPSDILQKDVGCNRKACYHLECTDNICMQAVTVEDVYEAVGSKQNF